MGNLCFNSESVSTIGYHCENVNRKNHDKNVISMLLFLVTISDWHNTCPKQLPLCKNFIGRALFCHMTFLQWLSRVRRVSDQKPYTISFFGLRNFCRVRLSLVLIIHFYSGFLFLIEDWLCCWLSWYGFCHRKVHAKDIEVCIFVNEALSKDIRYY